MSDKSCLSCRFYYLIADPDATVVDL